MRILMTLYSIGFFLVLLTALASADEKSYPELIEEANALSLPNEKKQETFTALNDSKAEELWGNFGVSILYNQDLGSNKPVKSAKIVGGKVYVEEENDVRVGLGLEAHKYVTGWTWNDPNGWLTSGVALGPYASVLPGVDNQFIDSVGAGAALGFYSFKTKYDSKGRKEIVVAPIAMNILLGCYADPGTKVLASGFEDGQNAPVGATEVEYKTVTQWGFQLGVSFSATF